MTDADRRNRSWLAGSLDDADTALREALVRITELERERDVLHARIDVLELERERLGARMHDPQMDRP